MIKSTYLSEFVIDYLATCNPKLPWKHIIFFFYFVLNRTTTVGSATQRGRHSYQLWIQIQIFKG